MTSGTHAATRLDGVEMIRVAAACGVIWAHLPGLSHKQFGHAGLICFILISVILQARTMNSRSVPGRIASRFRRISRPWMFWFAFHLAANTLRGSEAFPHSQGAAANLLTGPWIGLWYLPFILLVSPLVQLLAVLGSKSAPSTAAAGFLILAAGLWSGTHLWPSAGQTASPWQQWLHAAAAIPLGMAMATVLRIPPSRRPAAMAAVLAAGMAVCVLLPPPLEGAATAYATALPLVATALLVRQPMPLRMARLGSLCLGVYLLHPVIIAVLKRTAPLGDHPPLLFAAVVATSFTAAAWLRSMPLMARFL
jgi:peptidoglycan/LPS O-acetylase OafA/YrhL